ncbi:NAD(P)-dependent oxidoreductase [Clostridium sp. C2-6-12]|uniref:NAD(P)-dependent oxidoreductase n=1 Tax=Clostridium sp. C2-6-12 TaxID=2698832 RepID=UPI001370171F|nr:NAD(P)-dependent oxidoreductase [Clostridium sp. C2-6-12]
MFENNREDISSEEIRYSYISFISNKLRIGIVGGGKAGTIKARHFIKDNVYVEVLSKTFTEDLIELSKESAKKLKLISEEFNYDFLKDKHLIIIAIEDKNVIDKIKYYCEDNFKIYIDSSDFKGGMGVIPIERDTKNISFALNTKQGNPKGAVLAAEKVKSLLEEYDDFLSFMGKIRTKAKKYPEYKNLILSFIGNDDFKILFDQGKAEEALRINFPKEIIDDLLKL